MYTILWLEATSTLLHKRHVQSSGQQMALELQHFDTKFEHIHGKNMVTDTVSRLSTQGQHQYHDNDDVLITTEDIVENIIKSIPQT